MLLVTSYLDGSRCFIAIAPFFCLLTEWGKNYNNFLCSELNLNENPLPNSHISATEFLKYFALHYSLQFLPIEYVTILSLRYLFCDSLSLWNISLPMLYFSFISSECPVLRYLSPCLWVSEDKGLPLSLQYAVFQIFLHFNYFHSLLLFLSPKCISVIRICLFAILHVNIILEQFLNIL